MSYGCKGRHMSHKRIYWVCGLAVIAGCASASTSLAALPYRFSGIVTSVADDLSSEFSVGEIVSGQVLIQASPLPSCPICLGATYDTAKFKVNFGGDYFLQSESGVLIVHDDTGLPFDQILFNTTAPLGLSGPSINGHVADDFVINLRYNPGDLTGTDLLEQFAPATSIFGDASGLRFDVDDELDVNFIVNDFSLIPEPYTLPMFLSAAIGLLLRRVRPNIMRQSPPLVCVSSVAGVHREFHQLVSA